MTNPISASPLRIHANTNMTFFDQVKKCCDAFTQFVMKIFKQIGEFFYNLFHTGSKDKPQLIVNPVAPERQMANDPKNILAFLRGDKPNVDGLTIDKLLNANDDFLEKNHRWVQWAFPLEKPSPFNPDAPVLDEQTMIQIQNSGYVRKNILDIFDRTLSFYGLRYQNTTTRTIERGKNFPTGARNWLTPNNHNFLRITRIIHSLGLMLGQPNTCGKGLFDIMEDIYQNEGKGIIPERTYQFWKNAI